MQNVILQPCRSPKSQRNFEKTIVNDVKLETIAAFLASDEHLTLADLYRNGKLYIWGVDDSSDNRNYKKWKKVKPGDVVLFAWDKTIHIKAIVTFTLRNAELSNFLWSSAEYQNIYMVSEIESVDMPYKQFNNIVGYKPNNSIQGFQVLNSERSALFLSNAPFGYTNYLEKISEEDYLKTVKRLNKSKTLNTPVVTMQRKEQAFLRQLLFSGGNDGICAICGKKYPIDFLVAAHIKRRADCTVDECKDMQNIVMPVCKFGCDELYERGYLLVINGEITLNERKWVSDSITNYVGDFLGSTCSAWNENTKNYFEAHNLKFNI